MVYYNHSVLYYTFGLSKNVFPPGRIRNSFPPLPYFSQTLFPPLSNLPFFCSPPQNSLPPFAIFLLSGSINEISSVGEKKFMITEEKRRKMTTFERNNLLSLTQRARSVYKNRPHFENSCPNWCKHGSLVG